jgi:diaminohydroxyphosphoribosylaminopyrimidine deaminase/5-amino-6-(5-phosphoribosylamino)uracil reductase
LCADEAAELVRPFAKHVTIGLPYVTVKLAMSLDGRICDAAGSARWISSAGSRRATGRLRERVDAVMVGAETVRKDNPSLLCHTKRNDDLWRVVVSRSGRLPKGAQVFTDGAPNRTLVFRDAREALEELGRMGAMHVLCEGGLKLATSLADAGLVDAWIAVTAPIVIGSRRIADALRFRIRPGSCGILFDYDRIGEYCLSRG